MRNISTVIIVICALTIINRSAFSEESSDGEKPQWTYDPHTMTPEEKPDHQEDPQLADLQENFSAYWHNIGLGIGTYSPFYDQVQTDDQGGTNGIELNPLFYASATVHMARDFAWTPNFGFVYLRNNEDDTINKQNFVLKSDFVYLWDTAIGVWNLGLSPGLFIERISGSGGQTTLNNGTSTESFFVPANSSLAYNFTLGALIELFPVPEWSFKGAADVYSITNSNERAFSFTLLASWHFLGLQDFWE